jgi:DNA-binding GntR family transcriptional regulator
MIIVHSGKHMGTTHELLIGKLKARDPRGARKTLQKELDEAGKALMDKIIQEEAGSWHLGTGSGIEK